MKNICAVRSRESGFTLIELMIAMMLSLFLLGAITYVVVNSNKNYNTTDSLSRLQENARFATEFIARDLRRAGYLGCANDVAEVHSTLNSTAYGGGGAGLAINPLEGVESLASGSTWVPSGETVSFSNTPITGSDAIAARYLDLSNPITIQQDMPVESATLFVNPGHGLKAGDIIAVSDCDGADIMQLTNVNAAGASSAGKDGLVHNQGNAKDASGNDIEPGNSGAALSKKYLVGATVLKFGSFSYYVGTNSNGRRALFRQTTSGTEELVEGVENMQILYGEVTGTDRSPTTYKTASSVGNWQNVVSIRVGLLYSTVANTADGQYGVEKDTGTYTLNGTDVTPPAERRLRKMFVSTIMLRNLR
jgi:type IV pilus assembly protein PilW